MKQTSCCNDCVYARFWREDGIVVCVCELKGFGEGPIFVGNGEKRSCKSFKPENKKTTRQMCIAGFEPCFDGWR